MKGVSLNTRGVKFLLLLSLFSMAQSTAALAAIPVGQADSLKARAASQGELRLIVQLAELDEPIGKLQPAARQSHIQQIASLQTSFLTQVRQPGLRELKRFSTIPFVVLAADAHAIDVLARMPQVISIQEDILEFPTLASSLPVIGAEAAWTAGYDGTGQVIAILDTGVDTSHSYFSPVKVIAEACFSTNSVTDNTQSVCPGQANSSTAAGSGQNCPPDISVCAHGTHVAGIAVGNNGIGPNIGVAKGAGLIPIQVFSCISNSANCTGIRSVGSYPSDQILALEHVLTLSQSYDIASVNMSLGGSVFQSQAVCDAANAARKAAIDNLRAVGIVTIVASGNNSSRNGLAQPGCISTAISVGNTTDADEIYDHPTRGSNVAGFLDLLAPGTNINSAYPGGAEAANTGTSMAAPHVAGAWAILREARPLATIDEILETLRNTATVVNDERPADDPHPAGSVSDMRRINLDQALTELTLPRPEISSNPLPGSNVNLGNVTVGSSGAPVNITVSNSGDADLTLSCELAGPLASMFTLIQCPSPIVSSASVPISLRCDPTQGGALAAMLKVSSNDSSEPLYTYNLSCTGQGAEIVTLPVAGTDLDFAGVLINTASNSQNIQVSNSGTQALTLTCDLQGAHPQAFVIAACPSSVAASGQLPVSVVCQPDISGARSATLDITSNDHDEGVLNFDLSCTGLAPELETDPIAGSLLDFGAVFTHESSAPLAITIGNSGNAPLNLSCAVQGTNVTSFQVVQCPASIPPSQSAEVQLQCSPPSAGIKLAQLRINSDDVDEAEVFFSLTCLANSAPGTIFVNGFESE